MTSFAVRILKYHKNQLNVRWMLLTLIQRFKLRVSFASALRFNASNDKSALLVQRFDSTLQRCRFEIQRGVYVFLVPEYTVIRN
mmetsp:Transcript_21832/g.48376  ORF Transcript_21832/g.48376 Transcript_21832/m.48376 type:complete len:84 (+) Transcript_21832:171-422(+)